jgi:hypothetical protein
VALFEELRWDKGAKNLKKIRTYTKL